MRRSLAIAPRNNETPTLSLDWSFVLQIYGLLFAVVAFPTSVLPLHITSDRLNHKKLDKIGNGSHLSCSALFQMFVHILVEINRHAGSSHSFRPYRTTHPLYCRGFLMSFCILLSTPTYFYVFLDLDKAKIFFALFDAIGDILSPSRKVATFGEHAQ